MAVAMGLDYPVLKGDHSKYGTDINLPGIYFPVFASSMYVVLFLLWSPVTKPKTAVPFWGQNQSNSKQFVPKTGLQFFP